MNLIGFSALPEGAVVRFNRNGRYEYPEDLNRQRAVVVEYDEHDSNLPYRVLFEKDICYWVHADQVELLYVGARP